MKTLRVFLASAFVLYSVLGLATVRTVSNNPDRPGQFTQVDAAIAAAATGDTIYVHGSQFTYSDFSVTKRLVIIGAGYNSNNQFNLPTVVNVIYLNRDTGLQNASGSVITGFQVGTIRNNGNPGVDNITIFRNKINNSIYTQNPSYSNIYGNGWVIYNNIIYQVTGGSGGSTSSSSSNITIQNNIIYGGITGFSMSSILIDHNVFQGADVLGSNIFYATVTNNIFVRTTGNVFNTSVNFNTFNNNLSNLTTVSPTAPTNSFLGGTNSGAGNFIAVDPLFVSVTNLNSYSAVFDYRLQASSTVRNAGTDGTDLGIYGGTRAFPSGGASGSGFDTSPLPPIPQVTEVNILNATLQPGTPLNVNVKAKVNN